MNPFISYLYDPKVTQLAQKSILANIAYGMRYRTALNKAEEAETVRAHLQDEGRTTSKNKTVPPGMVEGNRPRGRPARRWSNDITDAAAVHCQRTFN